MATGVALSVWSFPLGFLKGWHSLFTGCVHRGYHLADNSQSTRRAHLFCERDSCNSGYYWPPSANIKFYYENTTSFENEIRPGHQACLPSHLPRFGVLYIDCRSLPHQSWAFLSLYVPFFDHHLSLFNAGTDFYLQLYAIDKGISENLAFYAVNLESTFIQQVSRLILILSLRL